MTATSALHDLGQSLWLDNISRDLLDAGTLKRYIDDLSITGLTSNPTIFDQAFKTGATYDAAIREAAAAGRDGEDLFFDLAIADLARAADLFHPIHQRTNGVDGWVSLEVSPLLVHDSRATLQAAKDLFARAKRPNLHIKIPGTDAGTAAVEDATFAGIPVNVTLLFSRSHYLAAADAWLRGVERRIAAGLDPDVRSVASIFVSRWDAAVAKQVPADLRGRLGIAMAGSILAAARELYASPRWLRVANAGARPQRILWASTGVKDPATPDTFYVQALASPYTVVTVPEQTLLAFADHGRIGALLAGGDVETETVLARHIGAGVDLAATAGRLQEDGARSFTASWTSLLDGLVVKCRASGKGR